MKLTLVACLVLVLFTCTDPFSFEPGDPTKPDPPAPPQLVYPEVGWWGEYIYPQNVDFGWAQTPGAQFFQIEVYRDSLLRNEYQVYANKQVTLTQITATINYWGKYFWRVRAASRNWNNYTDWSEPSWFVLPNPAR